ncbi:MAG: phosphoglycerate kinase, partial [Hyphomicrobiales bacterium]
MARKTLDDIDLNTKIVLTRVDINVPVAAGVVTHATRIERIVPTVRDILEAGGKPVLLAHFGRPNGQVVAAMSLRVTVPALQSALGVPVRFADDCIGPVAGKAVAALTAGEVLLLENTRFHAGEAANDAAFAAALAAHGDVYCNDAFSAAHRAHASTEAIAHLLPSCAGRLMQAELKALEAALGSPRRPVVAVVGGAKVSSKLELLGNLVGKVDHLVIGGGMANTFLAAQGLEIGTSLAERDMAATARDIIARAGAAGCKILLPVDIVVAREFAANAAHETVAADACPPDAMILDAGPATVAAIGAILRACETLIWNGPLGAFEMVPFDAATNAAAHIAAELSQSGGLISVAGG